MDDDTNHKTCYGVKSIPTKKYAEIPTVRTGHGTADWFQIGKGVRQGCILSPCLFNLYAEYIMRNKLEAKLLGEISVTLDMQMTAPLWQKGKKN